MSIGEHKYLTLQRTRSTRSSHNSEYCRPQTYSDALKYSFFPTTILHWNIGTIPYWNSLPLTVDAVETTEEFRALILMTQPEGFFSNFKILHSPDNDQISDQRVYEDR